MGILGEFLLFSPKHTLKSLHTENSLHTRYVNIMDFHIFKTGHVFISLDTQVYFNSEIERIDDKIFGLYVPVIKLDNDIKPESYEFNLTRMIGIFSQGDLPSITNSCFFKDFSSDKGRYLMYKIEKPKIHLFANPKHLQQMFLLEAKKIHQNNIEYIKNMTSPKKKESKVSRTKLNTISKDELSQMLSEALINEEYEKAAEIRNEIEKR